MLTIRAIFEDGVFKPESPVDLPEGWQVQLIVAEPHDDPVAMMKARFPGSFGCMPAEDADEMMKIIDDEFGLVNLDERQ